MADTGYTVYTERYNPLLTKWHRESFPHRSLRKSHVTINIHEIIYKCLSRSRSPLVSAPRVVGLDDWSWKSRLRYGTLICDLESHHPIDVFPDRSVETVSDWFEKHPSVEIVSRDRSSEYAAAIRKGAPQALEVADRWHITKNLVESVQTLLTRCRAEIRQALQIPGRPGQETQENEACMAVPSFHGSRARVLHVDGSAEPSHAALHAAG